MCQLRFRAMYVELNTSKTAYKQIHILSASSLSSYHIHSLLRCTIVKSNLVQHSGQTPTKRHSKPRALRTVEVHPGRKCSSEFKLCGEPSVRYIHVLNWKSSEVAPSKVCP